MKKINKLNRSSLRRARFTYSQNFNGEDVHIETTEKLAWSLYSRKQLRWQVIDNRLATFVCSQRKNRKTGRKLAEISSDRVR